MRHYYPETVGQTPHVGDEVAIGKGRYVIESIRWVRVLNREGVLVANQQILFRSLASRRVLHRLYTALELCQQGGPPVGEGYLGIALWPGGTCRHQGHAAYDGGAWLHLVEVTAEMEGQGV